MLNPNSRSLYTSFFTPPVGTVFDEAIATTFSMDPIILLETPMYLALFMNKRPNKNDDALIYSAIRKYSERISVYVQKGRIQVSKNAKGNPIFALLEDRIIQVNSPNGGVFHPKVWAIRFVSHDNSFSMLRLVVLSRNMTLDNSWDLSLQLEGEIGNHQYKTNEPLAHFFKTLPDFATEQLKEGVRERAQRFSDYAHRTQWIYPEGFDEIAFYLPWIREFEWRPRRADRIAIISPFCTDDGLKTILRRTASSGNGTLISRPETMTALSADTLDQFSKCYQLDERAETEDTEDEDASDLPLFTGLHAKAYVFEFNGKNTEVVVGSANATGSAIMSNKNIEILVSLIGRSKVVGTIDQLLGENGLGEYLTPFDITKDKVDEDPEKREAEAIVEKARFHIISAELSLICSPASDEGKWSLELLGEAQLPDGIASIDVWPITVDIRKTFDTHSGKLSGALLGEFAASSITSLIAFEINSGYSSVSLKFVLNLPITGIPEERDSAIVQTVIRNYEGFIRYLLLLLSDMPEEGDLISEGVPDLVTGSFGIKTSHGEIVPLLEELTRAFCRHPEKLEEISTLINDLSKGKEENCPIPECFIQLWKVFEIAIGERNAK